MSETKWKYHPSNPANQPFQMRGTPNKSKSKSWWNAGSPSFWRNRGKKVTKQQSED